MGRFHGVYDKLNQVLDDMPYNELGISVEVKEQVICRFPSSLHLSLCKLSFNNLLKCAFGDNIF